MSKAYRVWSPKDRKIHVSRDVKFFDEFNTDRSPEDIVTPDTKIGHLRVINGQEPAEEAIKTHVGPNRSNPIETQSNIDCNTEETVDENNRTDVAEPPKRPPGRPKGAVTRKSIPPSKQYYLRSSDQQQGSAPIVVESSSDDDIEWNEAEYALLANDISFSQAVTGPDATEWKDAIYDEIKSLVENDTWELVERPKNVNVVGCRIVLKNKHKADGRLEKRKARIVAKGFSQRPGIDFSDTFAPVARLASLRMLIALSAQQEMSLSQLDIASAYLHGILDVDVYMEAPELLEEILVRILHDKSAKNIQGKAKVMLAHYRQGRRACLLKKALYGLRQAGRLWNFKFREALKDAGLFPTNADPCVYVNKERTTFLLVYVDDILIASRNHADRKNVVRTLKR